MAEDSVTEVKGSKAGLWIRRGVALGAGCLILAGTVGGMMAMQAAAPTPEEKEDLVEALPVLVTKAVQEDAKLEVRAQGEVVARSEVNLASEVAGRVSYVAPGFLAGGTFKKGDILFRLDARDYEMGVTRAEASVAQAVTLLKREQSEAAIARQNAIDLGLDDISELALREPQVAEATAQLAASQASLSEARLRLERTIVRAPFSGRVKSKAVDIGAYVTPGSPLGVIFSSDVVEVPLALTDADLSRLDIGIGFEASSEKPGPDVRFTAPIGGQVYEWNGVLTRTDAGFDPDTRALFGYAEVKDPYGAGSDDGTPFATGLFVSAYIDGKSLKNTVVVPRTALRGTNQVYAVDDTNALRVKTVTVAYSNRDKAILTSGLMPGETVITSPVRGAADGMMVSPVDEIEARGTQIAAAESLNTQE